MLHILKNYFFHLFIFYECVQSSSLKSAEVELQDRFLIFEWREVSTLVFHSQVIFLKIFETEHFRHILVDFLTWRQRSCFLKVLGFNGVDRTYVKSGDILKQYFWFFFSLKICCIYLKITSSSSLFSMNEILNFGNVELQERRLNLFLILE